MIKHSIYAMKDESKMNRENGGIKLGYDMILLLLQDHEYLLTPSSFVYDLLGHEVISLIDDSCSEMLSVDSQDKGDTSRDSYFDALLFEDDVKKDLADTFMPLFSCVTEVLNSPTLTKRV